MKTRPVVCAAAVLLALSMAPVVQADTWRYPLIQTDDGPLYVMKGQDDPESIPYYLIWHGEFLVGAQHAKNPAHVERYFSRLKLTAEDREVFYETAAAQGQRDGQCKKLYTAWADMALKARGLTDVQELFRRQTPAEKADPLVRELGVKQMAVEVECRTADLRAADEMLARMSPAGRKAMLDWVEFVRGGTTAHSSPERMPWYFQPTWDGGRK